MSKSGAVFLDQDPDEIFYHHERVNILFSKLKYTKIKKINLLSFTKKIYNIGWPKLFCKTPIKTFQRFSAANRWISKCFWQFLRETYKTDNIVNKKKKMSNSCLPKLIMFLQITSKQLHYSMGLFYNFVTRFIRNYLIQVLKVIQLLFSAQTIQLR